MQDTFTLDELAQFSQDELKISKELGLHELSELPQSLSPSEHVLSNILNYSKVLSVRSSEKFGTIEMVLN